MNPKEISDLRQAYQDFLNTLTEQVKKRKEIEKDWVNWVTTHGGEFEYPDDCATAIFNCAGQNVKVGKTYKEMDFFIEQFETRINNRYQFSVFHSSSVTVHSYEEIEKELMSLTKFFKKMNEINNLLSIEGDF